MATVCILRGIAIQFYSNDHDPPHFHALKESGEKEMKVEIATLTIIKSNADARMERLVLDWAALHREELMENWDRVRAGQKTTRIDPV